jgi:predicted transcriptional regulator
MTESTFTFRVDEDLKSAFADLAKSEDRSAAQLLRGMMRDAIARKRQAEEHDAWFREQVEQAIREADDPNTVWIPHEEVVRGLEERQRELIKRIEDEST